MTLLINYLKSSFIYGFINVLSSALGFIIFPFILIYYDKSEFAIYDYVISIISFLTILTIFGQQSAFIRFYSQDRNFGKNVALSTIISLSIAAITTIILTLFAYYTIDLTIISQSSLVAVLFIGILLPVKTVRLSFSNFFRLSAKKRLYLIIEISYICIYIITTFLILYFELEIIWLLFAQILASILSIYLISYRKFSIVHFKKLLFKKDLVRNFKFGFVYVWISILSMLLPVLIRFFLNEANLIEDLANYGFLLKVVLVYYIITSSIQAAWPSFSYGFKDKTDLFKSIILFVNFFTVIFGMATVSILPFLVVKFFPNYYHSTFEIVSILLILSAYFRTLSNILVVNIDLNDKGVSSRNISFLSFGIVIIIYFLINKFLNINLVYLVVLEVLFSAFVFLGRFKLAKTNYGSIMVTNKILYGSIIVMLSVVILLLIFKGTQII
jgi:O-antigen/teichoic acid export membrane protein